VSSEYNFFSYSNKYNVFFSCLVSRDTCLNQRKPGPAELRLLDRVMPGHAAPDWPRELASRRPHWSFEVSRDTTRHHLGSFRILNALHRCAVAGSSNALDQIDIVIDLDVLTERVDIHVLADQRQRAVRGSGVERI
jgi:hypothetical protein